MTKRVLVADDDRSIREALSKVLRAENYEVVLAENGQEAIEKHDAGHPDLLLLDLSMPIKHGWAALECLTAVNPLLPVIIITGRSNQRALAETAGADALMEKPLDVPLLLQTIRELTDKPAQALGQRTAKRALGFRYAPCDHQILRAMPNERRSLPCPLGPLEDASI